MDDQVEVTEVVPGEYDVRRSVGVVRVLVPAGVGIAGVGDDDLAGALVEELTAREVALPAVLDVSELLRGDPELLRAVERRVDPDA